MKKYLLILIAGLFIFNNSKALTNVSGGIYANTTWTLAGSPYIITDTVVIFAGDTLIIEPGVVVKFDNKTIIESRGGLYAIGTPSDSIVFTSNSATPHAGIYYGIQGGGFFRYCKMSYADEALDGGDEVWHCLFTSNLCGIYYGVDSILTCTFKYDTNGINSPNSGWIISCEFQYNSTGIVNPQFEIDHSTFRNNHYGINGGSWGSIDYCTFDSNTDYGINDVFAEKINNCSLKYNNIAMYSPDDYVTLSDISYNTVGIVTGSTSIVNLNNISNNYIGIEELGGSNISCNTICSNTHYNIVYEATGNESAPDNYWCLSDSAAIQSTIYDAYQDINVGFIFFTPFDTVVCTSITTGAKELPSISKSINLYPNPNNGSFTLESSDISGMSSVEIYNMLGEMVYKSIITPSTTQIKLNTNAGIYLYRLLSETGNVIGTGRFIVE